MAKAGARKRVRVQCLCPRIVKIRIFSRVNEARKNVRAGKRECEQKQAEGLWTSRHRREDHAQLCGGSGVCAEVNVNVPIKGWHEA